MADVLSCEGIDLDDLVSNEVALLGTDDKCAVDTDISEQDVFDNAKYAVDILLYEGIDLDETMEAVNQSCSNRTLSDIDELEEKLINLLPSEEDIEGIVWYFIYIFLLLSPIP